MTSDKQTTTGNATVVYRVNPGVLTLWASAFVIGALVLFQAGRTDLATKAMAQVATVNDLTVLTVGVTDNEDVVVVLDQREELISVYTIEGGRNLVRLTTENLSNIFQQARAAASGGR